jgi:hypothetical protein
VKPDDDRDLDRRLEDAANPDRESVERIVSAALGAAPARRPAIVPLAVSVGLAGLIVTVIVLNRPASVGSPEPIRMRNVGEVILVDYPDGSRAIIGPATTGHELFAGFDYVMLQGERQ